MSNGKTIEESWFDGVDHNLKDQVRELENKYHQKCEMFNTHSKRILSRDSRIKELEQQIEKMKYKEEFH